MYKMTLKQRRKALKLTMKQVADFVGVSEATVSRWESGNIENMKSDKIPRLAKILQLNPMEIMPQRDETFVDDKTLITKNNIFIARRCKIPLVATNISVLPVCSKQNIEDYLEVPEGVDADFCIKFDDDSMINARIMSGDIVFAKRQENVANGQIAVVIIENKLTLKRIYKCDNSIVLASENVLFNPIVISDERLNTVKIEGVALAFLSPVR